MKARLLCFTLTTLIFTLSAYSQVGVGNTNPQAQLDISASSTTSPTNLDGILIPRMSNLPTVGSMTANQDGMLLFYTGTGNSGKGFYYWDNGTTSWLYISSGGKNTLDEAYDEGGLGLGRTITADNGALQIDGTDGLLVTGTFGSGSAISTSGSGTRMFFNPQKAAFRAGNVTFNQWDDSNVGDYSVAMGRSTTASGIYDTAIGFGSRASGTYSTALGWANTATGAYSMSLGQDSDATGWSSTALGRSSVASGSQSLVFGSDLVASGTQSVAIGNNATASGIRSIALGNYTEAPSGYEIVTGHYNTLYTPNSTSAIDATDRLFTIGNGTSTSVRSNALTIYKSGLMNINDEYSMPLTDGTANQIMATDGAGQVNFVNASTIFTDTDTDNQTIDSFSLTGTTLELSLEDDGQPLQTVDLSSLQDGDTQNTLDQAYDEGGAGAGRTIVADNGAVDIDGTGGLRVEGQNVDIGAFLRHDGDTDTFTEFTPNRIQFDAGGRNYIDIQHANTEITFNEDSTQSDFRVESGNQDHMLFVDGSNDAIGIGQNVPVSPLHVGIQTAWDLSYANSGQDGLYLMGSGDNSGLNAIGSSIGFGPPNPTRDHQRKAAIASIQTSGDADHVGLGFFVHRSSINMSDMTEGMRLSHNGYLGINNIDPSANLDVIGSMQFVDGNEASGYVLSSDASGNATWQNPNTLVTTSDDQIIDDFSLSGTTLRLSLEDDGQPLQTVDLSSLDDEDADWYEVGTTNPPTNNTDNIFTMGHVGIGDTNPLSALEISETSSDLYAVNIDYTYTGTGTPARALWVQADGSSNTPHVYGAYIQTLNSSSATSSTAVYAFNPATATNNTGLRGLATGSGTTNVGVKGEANDGASANYGGSFFSSGNGNTNYGINAYATGATTNYAAFFGNTSIIGSGDVYIQDNLEVDGSLNYTDGNEASGYVLSSDASGNANWVNPSTIFINTDNQTIDNFSLSGTTLRLSLEDDGQPLQTVNLASLQDGTGTDNQTIDNFSLSGTTLRLSLEDDGQPLQTVNLASLQDGTGNDWTTTGNAGTNPSTNFIGTTDNQDLAIRTNNTEKVRITAKGQIETTQLQSVWIGEDAGNAVTTGTRNVFIGRRSGVAITTGLDNTAVGGLTLSALTSGQDNTAIGLGSLINLTSGNGNTFVGEQSGENLGSGSYNTVIGHTAGESMNGSSNIFIGRAAGQTLTGSNLLVMDNANDGVNSFIYGEMDNELLRTNAQFEVTRNSGAAISHIELSETQANDGARIRMTNSVETTNEWLLFGRADDTTADSRFNINHTTTGNIIHIRGDGRVGINNSNPTYALELPNNATTSVGQGRANAWVTYSDGRVKKDQETITYGLETVLKMNPKSYTHYSSSFENGSLQLDRNNKAKAVGFIAQDLAKIFPEATFIPENENEELWSIDYEKIIPVTVKAIQELNDKIDTLEAENLTLKQQLGKLQSLEARLLALEHKDTNNGLESSKISEDQTINN